MDGKMPNLLIIGAMKCGTSSLHDYLSLHPDIFMSTPKEIHFFTEMSYNSRSLSWYKNHFKTDKKVIGTTPQSYTKCHHELYQGVPERIKKHLPNVKMIYIVRDPIKRYESHILESYHCDPPEDIQYSKKSNNYIKTGMYYMQIKEYLKYFKQEQIHILSLEDLQKNKLKELNKIFRFLEVDELTDQSMFDFISNNAESNTFPWVIQNNIVYRIGKKFVPRLSNLIAELISNKYLSYQMKKPNLTDKEKIELKEKMKDDLIKFRELTGKSFSNWSL